LFADLSNGRGHGNCRWDNCPIIMKGIFRGWPHHARGAVSLSFDDAVPSQLDQAIPVLDRYGLKGTFYVNPARGMRFERVVERWRQAHAHGHELGNHTCKHFCSGNFTFVGADRALELLQLDEVEADILMAERIMEELIPGLRPHSFAYPCGQTYVGRGTERKSYVPLVAQHFTVGRGVGESANDPRVCDLQCLSSWMVKGLSGDELIAMLAPVLEAGHWAVFCFHGIGGDHIRIDTEPFEQLIAYLADPAHELWVDTVQRVGEYVRRVQ
jgi:hypothetical protein